MSVTQSRQRKTLSRRQKALIAGTIANVFIQRRTLSQPQPLAALPILLPTIQIQSDDAANIATLVTLSALPKQRPRPDQGGERITVDYLNRLGRLGCLWAFRFTADELILLSQLLDIPDPLITPNRNKATAVEAFTLLCARLRSPEDQWALSAKYNLSQGVISDLINVTAKFLNNRWAHLLDWDTKGVVNPDRLQEYAEAIHDFGAPTSTIFGFIDCTIRPTCRPGEFQELVYTGYKKCHGMKFQGIVAPNGLMVHLSGPFHAPQNDLGVLAESGLLAMLERNAIQPGSTPDDPPECRYFQIYGDSVYGTSPVMVSSYTTVAPLSEEQRAWNMAMGKVRISVEHGFGLVLQDWPFLNSVAKHKILGTQCGTMDRIGVLLCNAHACLTPNQTSIRYGCMPPTVDIYFHD